MLDIFFVHVQNYYEHMLSIMQLSAVLKQRKLNERHHLVKKLGSRVFLHNLIRIQMVTQFFVAFLFDTYQGSTYNL